MLSGNVQISVKIKIYCVQFLAAMLLFTRAILFTSPNYDQKMENFK